VLCLKEAVQYPAGLPSVWHGHLKPAHKATLLDHYIKLFGIDKARINELNSWRALPLFSGPMEVAAAARAAATAPAGLESGQVAREGTALAAEPFPLATIVRHFKGDCPLSFLPMHMPLIPALTCLSCSMGQ